MPAYVELRRRLPPCRYPDRRRSPALRSADPGHGKLALQLHRRLHGRQESRTASNFFRHLASRRRPVRVRIDRRHANPAGLPGGRGVGLAGRDGAFDQSGHGLSDNFREISDRARRRIHRHRQRQYHPGHPVSFSRQSSHQPTQHDDHRRSDRGHDHCRVRSCGKSVQMVDGRLQVAKLDNIADDDVREAYRLHSQTSQSDFLFRSPLSGTGIERVLHRGSRRASGGRGR